MGDLAVVKKKGFLKLNDTKQIMEFGQELKKYIIKNELTVKIKGHDYAKVDAWKFAGVTFGMTAITSRPVAVHVQGELLRIGYAIYQFKKNGIMKEYEKVGFIGNADDGERFETWRKGVNFSRERINPHYAYECQADLHMINTGKKIGAGDGFCENTEATKVDFDQYAVRSMAQTRAIGKAFRNMLGYVMNAAGYETTPAEEMEELKDKEKKENDKRPLMQKETFKLACKLLRQKKQTLNEMEGFYKMTVEQKAELNKIVDELKKNEGVEDAQIIPEDGDS